jgi:hypothetical protein
MFQGVLMGKALTAGDLSKRKLTVDYKQTSIVVAAQLLSEDHGLGGCGDKAGAGSPQ